MKYKDNYRKEQLFSSITKLQDIHYNALSNDEDDRVLIVTGDTGAGKSNFVKWYFDWWYTKTLKIEPHKELLSNFCYGTKDWTKALKNIYDDEIKYHMLYNDEAINLLYYRDSTTKGAKLIKKNFNIIRYLNTYHVLTIPNCYELDPEIVRNRVIGMFYISKWKGKRVASYFTQSELLRIIQEIKDSIAQKKYKRDQLPKVAETKAFQDRIFYVYPPLYKGWVDESYMQGKHEQAGEAVSNLYEHYNATESKNEKAQDAVAKCTLMGAKIHKLKSEGYSYRKIAENNMVKGIKSHLTISKYHRMYKKSDETIS